jgi:hypothetical protein
VALRAAKMIRRVGPLLRGNYFLARPAMRCIAARWL